MKQCDIHIQLLSEEDIPEGMGNLGLQTAVHVEDADVVERLILMHTLARGLELNELDIKIYAQMELLGAFDHETIISNKPMGGAQ